MINNAKITPIIWENNTLKLLDQRELPHQETWLCLDNSKDTAQAITDMVVRGAPAIGITAAYGVVLAALRGENLAEAMRTLADARPTAVNLHWALEKMRQVIEIAESDASMAESLLSCAQAIHEDDLTSCLAMGELGADIIAKEVLDEHFSVMTHCNTGALATGGYGTALGVIRSLAGRERIQCVYVNETRPWLQGSRLTAWELKQEQIPHLLQADSAAAHSIREHDIRWVIVGADRVAANGDVVNKIGTFSLAIIAKQLGAKMMVVAPRSTVDMTLANGSEIPIEQRPMNEVSTIKGLTIAPADTQCNNPAFDMTPANLIDVLVTDDGAIFQPDRSKMAAHFGEDA